MVGAWCIGIGIIAAQTIWENDWHRTGGSMIGYALLGLLQLVAVARYASQVEWTRAGAWVYVVLVASVAGVGEVRVRKNG